ncbi:Hypothetical protein NTJ_07767 [Nesidiocoris tenuis]|uniref:Uncharacterized protein n=1 Tax=Nesidiocoris tenuis TaxID=355587 RepID=A0ABN7ASN1_9HEMI|nr:Hypothetical protein NTJ_07767 [Nesidiocoris tenuis]
MLSRERFFKQRLSKEILQADAFRRIISEGEALLRKDINERALQEDALQKGSLRKGSPDRGFPEKRSPERGA